jgi:hypothetical protein
VSDNQLTTLSTLAWLIGTVVLFILLAHWSAGGSWGISTAIARGLTGWAGRDAASSPGSRSGDDLRPIQPPRLDRLWGADRTEASTGVAAIAESTSGPLAELEDLGSRRLPH